MAQFTITDATSSSSVQLQLTFNPGGTNTWQVSDGDSTLIPSSSGVWNSSAVNKEVVIRDNSQSQLANFTRINISGNNSDPFSNLSVGDTGNAAFNANADIASWSFDSD